MLYHSISFERNLKLILDKTAIVYKKGWYLNELANDNEPEESDIPTVNTSLVIYKLFLIKRYQKINILFLL